MAADGGGGGGGVEAGAGRRAGRRAAGSRPRSGPRPSGTWASRRGGCRRRRSPTGRPRPRRAAGRRPRRARPTTPLWAGRWCPRCSAWAGRADRGPARPAGPPRSAARPASVDDGEGRLGVGDQERRARPASRVAFRSTGTIPRRRAPSTQTSRCGRRRRDRRRPGHRDRGRPPPRAPATRRWAVLGRRRARGWSTAARRPGHGRRPPARRTGDGLDVAREHRNERRAGAAREAGHDERARTTPDATVTVPDARRRRRWRPR